MSDEKYRDFQIKLTPGKTKDDVIGVRTPDLRKYASELIKTGEAESFVSVLPHKYFEEYQLHSFIISLEKDFEKAISLVELFLPYVDNWATCDQLSPRAFARSPEKLLPYIDKWIKSEKTYTVRFGVLCLMRYFLGERFDVAFHGKVAGITSGEYYVNMMRAWYFATALSERYEETLPYLENNRLDVWTRNKTISKARESFRITPEQKEYLKKLKR